MPYHRESRPGRHAADVELANYQQTIENHNPNMTLCCVPTGCFIEEPISVDELDGTVKVICNNEQCQEGSYMHRQCFEAWEQTVLTFLRSTGRARSWSEKQRMQNLWTKKGYDLAFKACGCKCGKGHLRKDLDWTSQKPMDEAKKRKNRKKKNDKPSLGNGQSGAAAVTGAAAAAAAAAMNMVGSLPREVRPILRIRTNSLSSTGSSPPNSSSTESPNSPTHSGRRRLKFEFFSDRNGSIFSRRMDFSSFNTLPRHKINSYHIKMEDDGNHGNDETRCFILSSLATSKTSKTSCILCHNTMNIFDRYPLIDGTFFLSPRQHSKNCIQVKLDGRQQYLCAVCMCCLEGWSTALRCRYCHTRWDGSSLILGTMYSYDIFAAVPCCAERLKCNNCHRLVILPEQRLAFFSDYSHSLPCPYCGILDFHFVKSLSTYNRRE